jgi:hypothetical protein
MKNSILGAIKSAKLNGGVTYSLNGGVLNNLPFYCISKSGYELIVPELTEEVVKNYLLKHSELLADDNNCLGIWQSDGKYVLDITDLWNKIEWQLDGILEIGRLRDQIAVFDLEEMKEIKCFDIEIYRKNITHVLCNSKEANSFMLKLGYESEIGSDNIEAFLFGYPTFTLLQNPLDMDRLEMLEAGLSVFVHNHK